MHSSAAKINKIPLTIFLSIFLISFTGLTLQITLTRIFSTTIWYHYAFMAISIALCGWGFSGVILHFLKQKFQTIKPSFVLSILLAFSLSMPIYLQTIIHFRFLQNLITLYYAISLIPFFLAGMCIAFFYSEYAGCATKLYLADLVGASFACFAIEVILSSLGAESTVLLIGVIGSIAAIFLAVSTCTRKFVVISLIFLIATSTIFAANVQYGFINVSYSPSKSMFRFLQQYPNLHIGFTKWNSFSRVDVVEGFEGQLQAEIFIDADASTSILKWDGQIASLENLKNMMDFLPYYLVENPKTLIIGSGGGRDVLFALVGNSSKVVAVELNPLVIEAVRRYKNENAYVYDYPNVELYIDEGRSFIRRSSDKFDVITLTLVDSWAAISAGGYALAENYLYTTEAFVDYLDHLTDNGLLIMIRWESEVPRLISTIAKAFMLLGKDVKDVGKHVAVVLNEVDPAKIKALLIVKKNPFTQTDAEVLSNQTRTLETPYRAFYVPYIEDSVEPYSRLFNGSISLEEFYNEFPYRVDAVSDDSPYYFNFEKNVPRTLADLTVLVLFLTIMSISVPWAFKFWRGKRKRLKTKNVGDFNWFPLGLLIVYFSALGIGYMVIEIAIIQKFILFLGYPTRALTVTLFSLLLSSGIGSSISGHLTSKYRNVTKTILLACLSIIILITVYTFTLPMIFELLLPTSSSMRIMVTVLLIFPLGFFMGMPFPSGISILKDSASESVPWIWGINGAMSVLGSILATIGGILLGFSLVLLFGIISYFTALVCVVFWMKRENG